MSLLRNQQTMRFIILAGCCIYAFFLFAGINDYVQGGKFSQAYLKFLIAEQDQFKRIYLINQPSQYKGTLLFRAYGDKANNSERNGYTVLDFMHSLYKKNNSEYITLSKKEILPNDSIKNVIRISTDSLTFIFPDFYLNETKNILINSYTGDSAYFENGRSIIVGLKLPSIYIFK